MTSIGGTVSYVNRIFHWRNMTLKYFTKPSTGIEEVSLDINPK